jgi:hypothetical protein
MGSEQTGRPFTVAVLIAWESKVLLHLHRELVSDVADSVDSSEVYEGSVEGHHGSVEK